MAKKTEPKEVGSLVNLSGIVELFTFKDQHIVKYTGMTLAEALAVPKTEGWVYKIFQPGYCQTIPTKIINK